MKIEKIPENQDRYCENCIESKKAKFFLQLKHTFSIYFCESCLDELQKLEKPKKKIKKWQWLMREPDGSVYATNNTYTSEEEVKKFFERDEDEILYKIPESEIEVDCE